MLSPAEFVDQYAAIGDAKCKKSASKLFFLGILAGFLIGMGGLASSMAGHALTNASAGRLVSALVFPFGLIMVILTGAELFTGNCLITISVMTKKTRLSSMVYNLVLVYLGNFVGSFLLAAAAVASGVYDFNGGSLALAALKTGVAKCSLGFGNAFILGILCNILVCIAVMCSLIAKDVPGRAIGAYLPVAFFVLAGFEHCIANMYYVPASLFIKRIPQYAEMASEAGVALEKLGAPSFITHNLIPVTLGNILGGCLFAALICMTQRRGK